LGDTLQCKNHLHREQVTQIWYYSWELKIAKNATFRINSEKSRSAFSGGRNMAMDINSDDFEKEVLHSQTPVLVDFWGPNCGPCRALTPHLEKIEEEYGGKFKLVKIDASKNRRFCLTQKVTGLPTFLLYKDGQEIERLSGGGLQLSQIREVVEKVLA
jgi:thioredoxin 1